MATDGAKTKRSDRIDPTEFLRDGIAKGRFFPNERLVETDLAAMIGTNRANVRTALARLEQEGLVIMEPNRGARVRRISDDEAIQIVQARSALEVLVVRFAALRATPADIKALEELVERMNAAYEANELARYSSTNGLFHKKLQEIAKHEAANRLLNTLRTQMVRFQYQAISLPNRATKSLAEHRAILEAIRSGVPNRAEHAMRRHLLGVIEGIEQAIAAAREV